MKLAIFDMDGTLMPIDVGVVWVEFLAQKSGAELSDALAQSKQYLQDYRNGCFQVEPFMKFHMGLLTRFPRSSIESLRERFVQEVVRPNVTSAAKKLVALKPLFLNPSLRFLELNIFWLLVLKSMTEETLRASISGATAMEPTKLIA